MMSYLRETNSKLLTIKWTREHNCMISRISTMFILGLLLILSFPASSQISLKNIDHFGGTSRDYISDAFSRDGYIYSLVCAYSNDFNLSPYVNHPTFALLKMDSALTVVNQIEVTKGIYGNNISAVDHGANSSDTAVYYLIVDQTDSPPKWELFKISLPNIGLEKSNDVSDLWVIDSLFPRYFYIDDNSLNILAYKSKKEIDKAYVAKFSLHDLSLISIDKLNNTSLFIRNESSIVSFKNNDEIIIMRSEWKKNANPLEYELIVDRFINDSSIQMIALDTFRGIRLYGCKYIDQYYYVWGYIGHYENSNYDPLNGDAIVLKYSQSFEFVNEIILEGKRDDYIKDLLFEENRIIALGWTASEDADFHLNKPQPNRGNNFIAVLDKELDLKDLDYIGGKDSEWPESIFKMGHSTYISFTSDNKDSTFYNILSHGDRDAFYGELDISKDCDSIVMAQIQYDICFGDSINLYGVEYTDDTIVMKTIQGIFCDTVSVANIHVLDEIQIDVDSIYLDGNGYGFISIHVTGGAPPFTYIWNNSDSNENYADSLSEGIQHIAVVDSEGCAASISLLLTSTNDKISSSDFLLYPNPSSDFIFLHSSAINPNLAFGSYKICDMLGTSIINNAFNLNSLNEVKIDISELTPSIYYLILEQNGIFRKGFTFFKVD